MNSARRHMIYYYFLTECCLLRERDCQEVERVWGATPEEARGDLIRSVPSHIARIIVLPALADAFDYDLSRVPGFYYDYKRDVPFNWRLNLKPSGLFKPYTDERGRILGLYVYRSAYDMKPRLLTSEGLTLGMAAIQPQEVFA